MKETGSRHHVYRNPSLRGLASLPVPPDASSESFLVGLEDQVTYEPPKKGPDRARSRRLTLGM